MPLGSIVNFRFSIIVSLFFLHNMVAGGTALAAQGNWSWDPRVALHTHEII